VRLLVDAQCVQSSSSLRGIGRYALALTRALVQERDSHRVEVLLNGGDDPDRLLRARIALETFLPPRSIHVFDAAWPWTPLLDEARRPAAEAAYAAAVRSLNADALLVLSPFEGDNENVMSIRPGAADPPTAAVLFDLIPALDPGTYLLGPGAKDYWRRLDEVRRCSALLAISEYSGRQATQVLAKDCPPVTPVWGGAFPSGEFPQFEPASDDQPDLVLPESFLLSVGGDHPRKNLDRLVEAWGGVPASVRDAYPLVLACRLNTGTVRRLRRLAGRVGVAPSQLMLTGGVSETTLHRLYRSASAFVFPSTDEGLGMPPLEAMAADCPTILARGSSLDELCDEDDAYFDGFSVPAMTAAVQRVLMDGDLRERLCAAGARSSRRFTWQHSAQQAWRVLEGLPAAPTGSPRPPAPIVPLSDVAAVASLPSAPAVLLLDTGPSSGSSAVGLDHPLRVTAAPATALLARDEGAARAALGIGLLDHPVLLNDDELAQAHRHDFYAEYAAGLRDLPLSLPTAAAVVRAVASAPRWTLQRPRPVWLLVTDESRDSSGLQDAAAAAGVELVVGGQDMLALGSAVDVLLVPAEAVSAWNGALAHARRRGARVAALHTDPPTEVSTPDWCEDVVLSGPPTVAASWGLELQAAAARWGRTTGWPWRVDA
jgi:glycosyltransferase involved in cell wall biosynthesis